MGAELWVRPSPEDRNQEGGLRIQPSGWDQLTSWGAERLWDSLLTCDLGDGVSSLPFFWIPRKSWSSSHLRPKRSFNAVGGLPAGLGCVHWNSSGSNVPLEFTVQPRAEVLSVWSRDHQQQQQQQHHLGTC